MISGNQKEQAWKKTQYSTLSITRFQKEEEEKSHRPAFIPFPSQFHILPTYEPAVAVAVTLRRGTGNGILVAGHATIVVVLAAEEHAGVALGDLAVVGEGPAVVDAGLGCGCVGEALTGGG